MDFLFLHVAIPHLCHQLTLTRTRTAEADTHAQAGRQAGMHAGTQARRHAGTQALIHATAESFFCSFQQFLPYIAGIPSFQNLSLSIFNASRPEHPISPGSGPTGLRPCA